MYCVARLNSYLHIAVCLQTVTGHVTNFVGETQRQLGSVRILRSVQLQLQTAQMLDTSHSCCFY